MYVSPRGGFWTLPYLSGFLSTQDCPEPGGVAKLKATSPGMEANTWEPQGLRLAYFPQSPANLSVECGPWQLRSKLFSSSYMGKYLVLLPTKSNE